MPAHKTIAPLQSLAHDKVLYMVCSVILDDLFFGEQAQWEQLGYPVLTIRLQTVRDVLANALVPRLLQDLLNTILERDEAVEASVRFTALQLLLVPGVTRLTVGHFPESFYTPVLSAIADSAAELETLDLRGVWVRPEHKFYLCKAIRRIHTIRNLTLRYTCDDEVLAIIGKHCHKLEKLDISGSENISEDGIRSLYEKRSHDTLIGFTDLSKTLKIVDIGGPGAQHMSVTKVSLLLRFLPNLMSLGAFERTGAALESLHSKDPTLRFKLVYVHDIYTNSERIDIIVKTCPNLHGIYLDCPKGTTVQNLHLLSGLKDLKVHKVQYNDLEITLNKMGHRLRSLYMSTVWGTIDIYKFAGYCPELEKLEIHGASLISTAPGQQGNRLSKKHVLPQLKDLLVYRTLLSSAVIEFLFSCSSEIKHFSLGDCNQIHDTEMVSAITIASLKQLKEIWFGQAIHLTMETVQCLIDNCPALTSIGNLAGWDIGPGETAFLRIQLALTNTELTLHDLGPDKEEDGLLMVFGILQGDEEEGNEENDQNEGEE